MILPISVNYDEKKLSIFDDFCSECDKSEYVINWENLLEIIRPAYCHMEFLLLCNIDNGWLICNPATKEVIAANMVFSNKMYNEIVNWANEKINLQKEVERLNDMKKSLQSEVQVRLHNMYKVYKNQADDFYAFLQAFIDAGFTHDESMKILMTTKLA